MERRTLVARLEAGTTDPIEAAVLFQEGATRVEELERQLHAAYYERDASKDTHRGRNFNVCRAVDGTLLSIAADSLIEAGGNEEAIRYFEKVINGARDMMRLHNPKDGSEMRGDLREHEVGSSHGKKNPNS